ncbi:MAG TPA: hypothetical protein VHN98_05830 [Acidimicrobiales bacterium]|nr:hypothetical protein [Acidimicrobiales bacterium]
MSEHGARSLAGHRLEAVVVASHEVDGRVSALVPHVWLVVDGLGALQLHTPGDGSVAIVGAAPYSSYEMGEHDRVVVGPAPASFPLSAHIGSVVTGVDDVIARDRRAAVGLLLRFGAGAVGVVNVADELLVLPWPSPQWDEMGLVAPA